MKIVFLPAFSQKRLKPDHSGVKFPIKQAFFARFSVHNYYGEVLFVLGYHRIRQRLFFSLLTDKQNTYWLFIYILIELQIFLFNFFSKVYEKLYCIKIHSCCVKKVQTYLHFVYVQRNSFKCLQYTEFSEAVEFSEGSVAQVIVDCSCPKTIQIEVIQRELMRNLK